MGRLRDSHVAFGTDINALARPAMSLYADLRWVVDHMLKRGRSDGSVRKIAIENYARVLTSAIGCKAG